MAYDGYGKRQRMDSNNYGMAPPSKRVREVILRLQDSFARFVRTTEGARSNSGPNYRLFVPKTFRSEERKVPMENFRSRRTKVPGNFCSHNCVRCFITGVVMVYDAEFNCLN